MEITREGFPQKRDVLSYSFFGEERIERMKEMI